MNTKWSVMPLGRKSLQGLTGYPWKGRGTPTPLPMRTRTDSRIQKGGHLGQV